MELYRIYLRAYVTSSGKLEVNIQGAELEDLAACALAIHDAACSDGPRTAASVVALVADMCKKAPSCA